MKVDELLNEGMKLFKAENFDEVKQRMFEATVETAKWQFEKCHLYRNLCKSKGFDPRRDLKSIENLKDIPYITTANFKQKSGRPKELLCVPEDQIHLWALSSGTSGDPSMVGRDWTNIKRIFKEFKYVMEYLDIENIDYLLLFTPPLRHHTFDEKGPVTESQFMYFYDLSIDIPPNERIYALKLGDAKEISAAKRFELDAEKVYGFLNKVSGQNKKIWIGGSVPLMYGALIGYYKKTGRGFELNEKCMVTCGGGWKSFSGEAVDPETFRKQISNVLNIPTQNIRDMYQFTETDAIFQECEYHNKHVYPWIDVIVRDTETLEPVKKGEKGLINVINPLAYSYAGVSILQDDIVRITHEDDCPCGFKGKTIEVLGRAKGAEAKGCGAQIAEMTND
ncbi:MAG: LuxE/PaaK family acyltransferase [Promethearchaeota archaeon]